jgi:outer membrane lipoprotein-sorting protein
MRRIPIILFLLGGCASSPVREPPSYPLTLSPSEAVDAIARRVRDVQGIRAEILVATEQGTLNGYLWAEAGGRLRIVLRRWFATALDLLIEGDRVVLHLPQRKKVLESDPDGGGGPLLATRDLMQALLRPRSSEKALYEGPESLVLVGSNSRWFYDRRHLLLRRVFRPSPEMEVTVGSYERFGDRWWPVAAKLRTPTKMMEITLANLETNPALREDHFHIEVPDGTIRVSRMEDLEN